MWPLRNYTPLLKSALLDSMLGLPCGLETKTVNKVSTEKLKKDSLSFRLETAVTANTDWFQEESFSNEKPNGYNISLAKKPVFVFKTIADALSVIHSANSKIPLVCLTDIQQNKKIEIHKDIETDILKEENPDLHESKFTMSDVISEQTVAATVDKSPVHSAEVGRASKQMDHTQGDKRQVSANIKKAAKGGKNQKFGTKDKDISLAQIRSMYHNEANTVKPVGSGKNVDNTPKSGGRKLKCSPEDKKVVNTRERTKSPKSTPEKSPPEIVVTPPKENNVSRKSSQSPQRRASRNPRKSKEETAPNLLVEKEKTSPNLRKRSDSSSPNTRNLSPSKRSSPNRRKLSPGSGNNTSLHLEIPDSGSGSPAKRTRSPNARFKEDMILYPWDSVKKSPKKSPADKNKEKCSVKNEKDSEVAKSPICDNKTTGGSPKKVCSPNKKLSPKKEDDTKAPDEKSEPLPGTSSAETHQAVRSLSFDSDIPKAESISRDFKYKYQSSKDSSLVGLSDLITKVSSSIESTDENLNALFGQAEEQDDSEDTEIPEQDSSNSVDDSTDSDKTITEFDNSHVVMEKNEKDTGTDSSDTGKESDASFQVDASEIKKEETDELKDNTTNVTCDNNEENILKSADEKFDKTETDAAGESKVGIQNETQKTADVEETESEMSCLNNEQNKGENDLNDSEQNVNTDKIKESVEVNEKETENDTVQETTSIFDMFGLKLKRKPMNLSCSAGENDLVANKNEIQSTNRRDSVLKDSFEKDRDTDSGTVLNADDKIVNNDKGNKSDDDVMVISEVYPHRNKEVIVLSDDDIHSENDGSSKAKVKKPKFISSSKNMEPTPLDILSKVEKQISDKKSVFLSAELDSYLAVNKENIGPSEQMEGTDSGVGVTRSAAEVEKLLENPFPDFDEIDDMVFLSFSHEEALNAHMKLEKTVDWVHDASIKKLAHLKSMKERQQDLGTKRMTDIKFAHEQKQNFRGVPMKLIKYNKLLKQELEALLTEYGETNETAVWKSPEKTSDITKIKGWKNKYSSVEEWHEAAGRQLSESGKLHWRTEERLLKNLDPEDVKDIGLDLKKKRRKLVSFSKKRGTPNSKTFSVKNESDEEFDDYEVDDSAITEKDVYNEDDDKPLPDKVLYRDKYLSQHKYGARKLFVKKMGLDSKDEMILKKLGMQAIVKKEELEKEVPRQKRHHCWFTVSKLTQSMAVAAVSALDKKLISDAKALAMSQRDKAADKVADQRNRRRSPRKAAGADSNRLIGGTTAGQDQTRTQPPTDEGSEMMGATGGDESEWELKQEMQDGDEESASDTDGENTDGYEDFPDTKHPYTRAETRKTRITIKEEPQDTYSPDFQVGTVKVEQGSTQKEHCTQPGTRTSRNKTQRCRYRECTELKIRQALGCRYGCICHLCKLSDSGEEKEADIKPPCDKEYCKLGCICESIEVTLESESHCRKPACMFSCKCPPKQPKPDIPKEHDSRQKKKKKGRKGSRRKKTPDRKEDEDSSSPKEERGVGSDDPEDWEPPNKRKRSSNNSRFANLPRRESTYRLAKNLDAVSRKAMEVYASSEVYAAVRMRRRKSDPIYDLLETDSPQSELPKLTRDRRRSGTDMEARDRQQQGTSGCNQQMNPEINVFEISDEESDTESKQTEDSCRRTVPYVCNRPRRYRLSNREQRKSTRSPPEVIDLVDSDTEDNSAKTEMKSEKSSLPSSSEHVHTGMPMRTVTGEMGLAKKAGEDNIKWKTQMVCLKAKKKADDKAGGSASEIKLLEIISNCNWENDRTNMLSKISHTISKDKDCPVNHVIIWQNYCLHFLPQAEKPAIIPPELKSKLPNSMYSIRIRITQSITDMEKAENSSKEGVEDKTEEDVQEQQKPSVDNCRKHFNVKLQKKLIDKIKFAEKLRDLIIAEEKKGCDSSKFSVSLDGIEKALKKYKTQLWKAYTGSSNMTLMQLKKAVEAAKSGRTDSVEAAKFGCASSEKCDNNELPGDTTHCTPTGFSQDMNATLARIHLNQGLKIVCPKTAGGFVPLTNVSESGIVSPDNNNVATRWKRALPQSSFSAQTVSKQLKISNITSTSNAAIPVTSPCFVTSGPLATPQRGHSDVLLIPVQENGAATWDPSANPVLSAKMTIMPKGKGQLPGQTGASAVRTMVPPQGANLIPVIPVTMSQQLPVRYPNQTKKQPGINIAPCQALTGQPILLQSGQPGQSPIMINSIQPVSSSSPVYSSMQVLSKSVNLGGKPVPLQSNRTGTCSSMTGINQVVPSNALPVVMSVAGSGLINAPVPSSQVVSTSCSIYPIKLAPVVTNATTTAPPSSYQKRAKCIGTVPFQILQTKEKDKFIQVVPLSTSEVPVSNSKSITTVARHTDSPVSVINEQHSAKMQCESTDSVSQKQGRAADKENSDMSVVDCSAVKNESSNKSEVLNSDACEMSKMGDVVKSVSAEVTNVINMPADNEQKGNENTENKEISSEVHEIVSLAKSASIEIANALGSVDKLNNFKESAPVENKKESTDEDSDSCLIIDESGSTLQPVAVTENNKGADDVSEYRKRKMTSSAEIEEGENKAKKVCHGISSSTVIPVTRLSNTEEKDEIDVLTFDMDETEAVGPAKASRRKSQLTSLAQSDEFEITSVKVKTPEIEDTSETAPTPKVKLEKERKRRLALSHLFEHLSKVLKKFNPRLRTYTTGIPKGMILYETRALLAALKRKTNLLEECLEDGRQYQQSLKQQLQQHIDSLVKSGVPENIIKNFLKSVALATVSSQVPSKTPEPKDPTAVSSDSTITTTGAMITKPKMPSLLGNSPTLTAIAVSEKPATSTQVKPIFQQSLLSEKVLADLKNKSQAAGNGSQLVTDSPNNDIDPESSLLEIKEDGNSNDSNSVAGSDSQWGLAEESDDEEIRSTTGYDSLLDQDLDFMESDLLNENGYEELIQVEDAGELSKTGDSMDVTSS